MKHTDLRNLLFFSVAILLGMALAACGGGKYHGELLRAESILDSLPDSARERYVNETQDSIIEKLDSIPGIKGMYRTVAVYTFYGLSPKAISLLCGISVSNVYADKSRLREAIKQSENEHSDVLLKALK